MKFISDHHYYHYFTQSYAVLLGRFTMFHMILEHILCWVIFVFPSSDMEYRSFKLCMWSLCVYTHWGTSVSSKGFCRVCTEFDFREIFRWAQTLAGNCHPSMWWSLLIVIYHHLSFSSKLTAGNFKSRWKHVMVFQCWCIWCMCRCMYMHEFVYRSVYAMYITWKIQQICKATIQYKVK